MSQEQPVRKPSAKPPAAKSGPQQDPLGPSPRDPLGIPPQRPEPRGEAPKRSAGQQIGPPVKPEGPPVVSLTIVVSLTLLLIFGLTWLVAVPIADQSYSPNYEYSSRFQRDNAYGASANALEWMAKHWHRSSPGIWCVAMLLCLVVVVLERIRLTLVWQASRPRQ